MKRKHYLLSVEIGGVTNYAVRNLACIVGYKLTTDESKAETFGESIRKRWLAQYPSGRAVEVGDEKRPDLEELRQIKKELHGPLKPRAVKFGPKPPPKFGPKKPRAVKFGPRKPTQQERETAELRARDMKRAEEMLPRFMGGEEMVTYGRGIPEPRLSDDSMFTLVKGDDRPPVGFEPVTPEAVPTDRTRDQVRMWLTQRTGRIPALRPGMSLARYGELVTEAADAAHALMMRHGGRVFVYFKPSSVSRILKAEAAELEQQEQAKKAREAEREKMAREVDSAIKESRQKKNIARSEEAKERANMIWDRAVPAARAVMLERVRTKRPLSSIKGLEGESYDTLIALEYLATMRTNWQDLKGNDQDASRMMNFSQMLSDVSDRDFWEQYHHQSRNRPPYERDAIAAELAKRVKNYNALSGKALDVASFDAPAGFITYANGIKTQPYLVNLPENTILRIEKKPTKGYKNPKNSQFVLLPDGTWRRMELSKNNWQPYYPGGNTLPSVIGVLANSKPSEIHVIRPGTKEHDRYTDKARENDDVTPAVLELLREYMSGSRKKDAPKGIIKKYKGSDFHLLARALSAGLIERADPNDKEAVKLTQKGLDRL